ARIAGAFPDGALLPVPRRRARGVVPRRYPSPAVAAGGRDRLHRAQHGRVGGGNSAAGCRAAVVLRGRTEGVHLAAAPRGRAGLRVRTGADRAGGGEASVTGRFTFPV